jgi:hypothetical protein
MKKPLSARVWRRRSGKARRNIAIFLSLNTFRGSNSDWKSGSMWGQRRNDRLNIKKGSQREKPQTLDRPDAERRNRTADTGIFSPLLYRLSYLGSIPFYILCAQKSRYYFSDSSSSSKSRSSSTSSKSRSSDFFWVSLF